MKELQELIQNFNNAKNASEHCKETILKAENKEKEIIKQLSDLEREEKSALETKDKVLMRFAIDEATATDLSQAKDRIVAIRQAKADAEEILAATKRGLNNLRASSLPSLEAATCVAERQLWVKIRNNIQKQLGADVQKTVQQFLVASMRARGGGAYNFFLNQLFPAPAPDDVTATTRILCEEFELPQEFM